MYQQAPYKVPLNTLIPINSLPVLQSPNLPPSISSVSNQWENYNNPSLADGGSLGMPTNFSNAEEYLYNKGKVLVDGTKEALRPSVEAFNGASTLGKVSGTLQAAQGVFDAYNAYKTNKMAKEQMRFNKMESDRNYEAQKGITNSQLADRQAARVARDAKQYASVSDYMNKYGVK